MIICKSVPFFSILYVLVLILIYLIDDLLYEKINMYVLKKSTHAYLAYVWFILFVATKKFFLVFSFPKKHLYKNTDIL